ILAGVTAGCRPIEGASPRDLAGEFRRGNIRADSPARSAATGGGVRNPAAPPTFLGSAPGCRRGCAARYWRSDVLLLGLQRQVGSSPAFGLKPAGPDSAAVR